MKKTKKFLLLLLALVLMVGCGSSKKESTSKNKESEAQTETTASSNHDKEISDEITITDVRGREVTVKRPIKNAYYPFFYTNLMEVGGPDIFERVGSTSVYDTKNYAKPFWNILEEKASGFKDIVDVGSVIQNDFDFEKLVSTKPDVVIFANYQYNGIGENQIKSLEDLGIPVVFIDFTDMSIEGHEKSCRIIGQIFGKEERAEELIANYKEKRNRIDEIVNSIPENERKTAYYEMRSALPTFKDYGKSTGKIGYTGQIANIVRVKNIYEDIYPESKVGDVNPEYVLKTNPDLIFVEGSNFDSPNTVSVQSGLGIDKEKSENSLNELATSREGWEHLDAIKNGELYTYENDIIRSMRDYTVITFIGKAAYPEYFKEFDPEKENKEFMEKYLPLLPSDSTYFYKWNGK